MTIRANVIDLYHGDAVSNFKLAKAGGVVGIIHKASQGSGVHDPAYAARRKMASDAGLLWGAYHFATDEGAQIQVDNFLKCAQPDAQTLVALDYEPHGNHTMTLTQAHAFLDLLAQKMGRKPVLYSGNLIKEKLGVFKDNFFGSHRLWLAQYGPVARVQASWAKPWLWQFSGDGIGPGPHHVPGIPGAGGALDCNFYDGLDDLLEKEWAS